MVRTLRPHQRLAFEYALREQHPALFMEMRLGKTLVAIRRCKLYPGYATSRILVVAPSSALGSWEDELRCEGETFINLATIPNSKLPRFFDHPLWVLANKEIHLRLPELRNLDWLAVILDESTFIKNPKAHVTKYFLRNFRNVEHRWILTGTPNPETDLEFWPQLAFLDGDAFGCRNYYQLRTKYFQPSVMGHDWICRRDCSKAISNYVGNRALLMSRREAGIRIPKIEERRILEFPVKIRKQYDAIEDDLEWGDRSTIFKTTGWCWCRQLCGGIWNHELVWPGKIDELVNLLSGELRNEPVVVWFEFNDEIHFATRVLLEANIPSTFINGDVDATTREHRRRLFQSGELRVILCQWRVADLGMNLSKADTAIYYSEPVGTLASLQTQDRTLGLDKKGLLYIYLTVKDSVDEDIRITVATKQLRSSVTLSRALQQSLEVRRSTRHVS